MDYTSAPLESRIDWVTFTASKPPARQHFWNLGLELVKLAAAPDLPIRRWKWKGYDGQHAQGVTLGRRDDSDILQLSGPFADEHFDLVYSHADNVTRIDLAVTVKVEGDVSGIIDAHQREVLKWKQEKPRTLTVGCIYDEGKPATLYLGQRVSDLFCRIYDKHLESGRPDYEGCVRYEVEIKGAPAERTSAWLYSAGNRASCIRDGVYKHCVQRGLTPRFGGLDGAVRINTIRPVSDADSRLAWLSASVRPVVERLLAADRADAVIAALGLRRSVTEMFRLREQLEWGNHHNDLFDDEEM